MKIIWAKSPIMAREVIAQLKVSQSWHAKTIRTLMARLVKKGALGYQSLGRAYLYRPLVKEVDCVRAESASFIDRVFDGELVPMLTQVFEARKLSDAERREIRLLVGDRKYRREHV